MTEISPARRRELKALAHHLEPVVAIAGNGLSPAVLNEIDVALQAHELIKIRVFGDDREARRNYLEEICRQTGATPVQSIGKLLVVWRERADEVPAPAKRKPRNAKPLTKRAAQLADENPPRRARTPRASGSAAAPRKTAAARRR